MKFYIKFHCVPFLQDYFFTAAFCEWKFQIKIQRLLQLALHFVPELF